MWGFRSFECIQYLIKLLNTSVERVYHSCRVTTSTSLLLIVSCYYNNIQAINELKKTQKNSKKKKNAEQK